MSKEQCYRDTLRAITSGRLDRLHRDSLFIDYLDDVTVVHGRISSGGKVFPHSWIEFSTSRWNFVWDPQNKEVFERGHYYKQVVGTSCSYGPEEYLTLSMREKTYGPFE